MSQLGVTLTVFGLSLPPLTNAVDGDPGPIANVHQVGGNTILILAGLHAGLALWHHFVWRDNTLRRMTPY